MNEKSKILIIDDDTTMLNILREILHGLGYEVHTASDGREALKLHKYHNFQVIISDLEMPVMSGYELINSLKQFNDETVIIVLTVNRDPEKIIEIMKMNVHDYLLKPVTANDIEFKVRRAFETAELRSMKKALEMEKRSRIENQLEWYKYTDSLAKKNYHRFDRALFESLHASFTKGAGVGTILTILKMISETAEKQEDMYLVDRELFDVVLGNAKIAENAIGGFSEIIKILNAEIQTELISVKEFYGIVKEIISDIQIYSEIENHKILINEPKEFFKNIYFNVNVEQIITAMKELLINAMKFSPKSSTVMVIVEPVNKNVEISVINTPIEQIEGVKGIPGEYERIVFEPFYRMSRDISLGYDSLDYGLGLSLVEIILQKHHGTVEAANVRDYSMFHDRIEERVSVTMQLPLQDSDAGGFLNSSRTEAGNKDCISA